ncbi:MAG: hypothetical protein DPW09_17275 [Anaerolineae bacterium]|nr:hypothetical protein [Anaerolineae bacterium]
MQTEPAFGRVYAAYGGIFIIHSILWGYWIDGWRSDHFDWRVSNYAGATLLLIQR